MRRPFTLSTAHSSASLKINEKESIVSGQNGYRSVLALPFRPTQTLYYEAQIENDLGYARFGVATKECELFGPVGIDENGYSFGSKNGYGFHNSKRLTFGERFGKNDIISVCIYKKKKKLNLEFFINGSRLNKKFKSIKISDYYPAISVFGGCTVSCNFGMQFSYYDSVMMKINTEERKKKR